MQRVYLIAVLAALISCAFAQNGYTVAASIKNEFPGNLTFVGADLFLGSWTVNPEASIAGGSGQYEPGLFAASGAQGTSGYAKYVLPGSPAVVVFYFENTPQNQNFNCTVHPSPWIGGVGNIDGNTDITVQYWVHQMCVGPKC